MDINGIKKLNIPASPGCYQFLDKAGKIIYIGKAANLKNRVLSYWQKSADLTPAKEAMLLEVKKIKWVETESEIEALLLEANLIKKHQPKFNVVLRDDKRFTYIKISTEEDWPRVFMTRKLEKSGRYFGPFTSVQAVGETLRIIRKIWPFRSCRRLPKKVCLYFRIGKCPGVCEAKISKNEYKKIIRQISLFLEGRKKEVVKQMGGEIKRNKDNTFLKYQLLSLNKILAHANILSLGDKYAADVIELAKILSLPKVPERIEGYDISNIFGREAVGSMAVFSGGEPEKNEYRKFKIKINPGLANDVGMLKEVLERRFKHTSPPTPLLNRRGENWPLPDLIIIDGGKAQLNMALRILKKFKLDISAIAVSKGEGRRSAQAPDKIFFAGEGKPLELPLASPALHIIKRVRDEAHRFAIAYHRKLRKKAFF
ncbi:MAG: excinuclease ABC subunit UvrC [Patescibacteria group bacterium]|nr:excinuclease ABC subunit UvrC [Patescibacteria group bacterium]MDD5294734.1 excinuclease ABC subunit UvrC [Patescibacteria group bacterium]MDD5554564.1 excinuclease ABC subunit UvrC [Patescibacteria group bacterium]